MRDPVQGIRIAQNSISVVVLVSSQHGGVGLIRSLGMQGIPVYSVHEGSFEPSAWSRFAKGTSKWNFAEEGQADSIVFLRDLAKRIGTQPILIPTSDVTALFVAENVQSLAEHFLIATPPVEVVRLFSSKKQTAELCQKLNIPSPETALPASREEAFQFARSVKFPAIVKGEYGEFLLRPGRRVRVAIAASEKDLLDIYDLNEAKAGIPQLIFQEYIPGGDDTICMFNGYFNAKSECLFAATGRKLRQYPAHRGSTSLGICENNPTVEAQTLRLMQAVAYRGPVDMGYRFDARDGQFKLLDVNPRVGATFRLFVAENGLDVGRALYLDLTSQPLGPGKVPEGRRWIVENNDLLSSWTYFREGQLTVGTWLRSLRDIEENVWLTANDPAPAALLPLWWIRKRLAKR